MKAIGQVRNECAHTHLLISPVNKIRKSVWWHKMFSSSENNLS